MQSSRRETRAEWVDIAKGIGILLVVYAHLQSSAYHSGIKIPQGFFALSDSIIYSFHMPLFFFLSGFFVQSSLEKRGPRSYLLDKFTRIAYPYLIWSILQVSVEVIFSSQTQRGTGVQNLLAIPYQPWGQFWFIYALFLMHASYVVLSRLGPFAMPVSLVIALVMFFYPFPTARFALFGFSAHFLFFVGGIYLKNYFVNEKEYTVPPGVTILLFVLLVGLGYYLFRYVIEPVRLVGTPYTFYFLILSLLGIPACIGQAQYFASKKLFRFLSVLGIYSLQIYLVHMLAGVATRMVLLYAFNIQNWVIHMVLGVTVALVAPILLQMISTKIDFPYLFELKKRSARIPQQFPIREKQSTYSQE